MADLEELLVKIRACQECAAHLPLGPSPIIRASASAKLLIIGQAPGTKVHASGIPWDDASGKRLRSWLGLTAEQFYDESKVAIVYVIAQLMGAVMGALPLLAWGELGRSISFGGTQPGTSYTTMTALIGEVLTTFTMVSLLIIMLGRLPA